MRKCIWLVLSFCLLSALPVFAVNEINPYIQIIKNDGGKIHGAEEPKNNIKSSLRLEWFVLNDPSCPIQLLNAGAREYEQIGSYPVTYHYQTNIQMKTHEAVAAYQVKFHLYNVFGHFMDELTVHEVRDLEAKEVYQQNEYFARTNEKNTGALLKVIAYITFIRKADGTMWSYNKAPIHKIIEDLTNGK
ncbi:MAG TPA: hypothetical protein VEC37_03320 [Bacillota bacterium]|nr:hypothetical protein [Bacillota bacterium]